MDYANAGSGYEPDTIASVAAGVITIAIMNDLLNLWGVPPFLREAFKGAIIIAVLMQKKERE